MRVEVTNLRLQNENKLAVATVYFYDEANSPHNDATVQVFVPLAGTLDEVKAAALEKAREFLRQALADDATVVS